MAASVVLTAAAALASCSNGGSSRASPPAPTPSEVTTSAPTSSSSSSSTSLVSTTTVASRPTTTSPAASPEGHARALYEAWSRGDRAAAEKVARPEAVTALFARAWQASDGWAFADCTGAAGSIICAWQRPSGQLLLRVQNVTGGSPVTVAEVRFQP